jgi:hypothetical protein
VIRKKSIEDYAGGYQTSAPEERTVKARLGLNRDTIREVRPCKFLGKS